MMNEVQVYRFLRIIIKHNNNMQFYDTKKHE